MVRCFGKLFSKSSLAMKPTEGSVYLSLVPTQNGHGLKASKRNGEEPNLLSAVRPIIKTYQADLWRWYRVCRLTLARSMPPNNMSNSSRRISQARGGSVEVCKSVGS